MTDIPMGRLQAQAVSPDPPADLSRAPAIIPGFAENDLRELQELWPDLAPKERALIWRLAQQVLAAEQRVTAILAEQRVVAALSLRGSVPPPPPDAWQSTVGMFGDDPILREITDTGRRLREAERQP